MAWANRKRKSYCAGRDNQPLYHEKQRFLLHDGRIFQEAMRFTGASLGAFMLSDSRATIAQQRQDNLGFRP